MASRVAVREPSAFSYVNSTLSLSCVLETTVSGSAFSSERVKVITPIPELVSVKFLASGVWSAGMANRVLPETCTTMSPFSCSKTAGSGVTGSGVTWSLLLLFEELSLQPASAAPRTNSKI